MKQQTHKEDNQELGNLTAEILEP